MLPYGVLFSVIGLGAYLNRKDTKTFSFFVFMFLALFYSFRNQVGVDWPSYENYFNNIHNAFLVDRINFETGYWLINLVSSYLFSDFRYLVLVVGIFNCILFWKATSKYTKNIGIAVLLASYYLFFPTLEAFRQSISLFIFYYSLQYIESNSKRYFILNIIGLMFHRTNILPLIFFAFNKYKLFRIAFSLAFVFYTVLEPYFFEVISFFPDFASKYYYYVHLEEFEGSLFTLKLLEYILILVFYFILSKTKGLSDSEKMWRNLILLGFILQISIGLISNIGYRMTYFTDIAVIFTYCLIYDKIKGYPFKYIYISVMIFYVLLRFTRVFPFDEPLYDYSI